MMKLTSSPDDKQNKGKTTTDPLREELDPEILRPSLLVLICLEFPLQLPPSSSSSKPSGRRFSKPKSPRSKCPKGGWEDHQQQSLRFPIQVKAKIVKLVENFLCLGDQDSALISDLIKDNFYPVGFLVNLLHCLYCEQLKPLTSTHIVPT